MKKLIALLFIILWLLMLGCGSNPTTFVKGAIIVSIESQSNDIEGCIYYTDENNYYRMERYGWFCDACNKYKVGDTVQTIKYIKPH